MVTGDRDARTSAPNTMKVTGGLVRARIKQQKMSSTVTADYSRCHLLWMTSTVTADYCSQQSLLVHEGTLVTGSIGSEGLLLARLLSDEGACSAWSW